MMSSLLSLDSSLSLHCLASFLEVDHLGPLPLRLGLDEDTVLGLLLFNNSSCSEISTIVYPLRVQLGHQLSNFTC